MSGRTPETAVETRLLVAFKPYGVKVAAQPGASLLDLASEAGVTVETPCGGQGRCGRCKVRFADPATARSAFRVRSSAHLKPEEQAEGYALACQTFVAEGPGVPAVAGGRGGRRGPVATRPNRPPPSPTSGDLDQVVAPRRGKGPLRTGHAAAQPEALPVSCDWRRNPAVRTFVRRDQTAVAGRQDERLRPPAARDRIAQLDIDDLRAELTILGKRLARTLREADWKVAVTLEMRDWVYGTYLPPRLIDVRPAADRAHDYGLAVDIGTTSVVAYLVDFDTAQVVDTASAYNAQIDARRGRHLAHHLLAARAGLYTLERLAVGTHQRADQGARRAQRHRADATSTRSSSPATRP